MELRLLVANRDKLTLSGRVGCGAFAMARDLKKFVNPKFVRTCDLKLMRRLLLRHQKQLEGFKLTVLDGDPDEAREALGTFLAGSESKYPAGLKADLHQIAELGNSQGMRLLIERAKAADVSLKPKREKNWTPDAKQLSLLCFLDHRPIFEAASDFLAIETKIALAEFRGGGAHPIATLNEAAKKGFEAAASRFLAAEFQGNYCRVGWYEDDGEINIVVVHGLDFTSEMVIEGEEEKVISFQPAGTAVLRYDPEDGRLKVGGLAKAQRQPFADMFAATMLEKPGFFHRNDAQDLYTLAAIEAAGFDFAFDHQFDAGIRSVKVIEAQADRLGGQNPQGTQKRLWSVLVRDSTNALLRMRQATKVTFPGYSLGHLGLRIEFDAETGRKPTVTVNVTPPRAAHFKRHVYEARIMELLRRNGLTVERKPEQAAIAAE